MCRLLIIVWVGGYALLWSVATIFFDPAVPYDAVEALNWAQNAEWGSPKNPWLVGMAPCAVVLGYLAKRLLVHHPFCGHCRWDGGLLVTCEMPER